MRDFVSRRVASVPPSGIRRFFDIAATMEDVISLGIGEPDFVTPTPILQAGIRSLEHGETHYTSNSGTVELRQAVGRAPAAPVRRGLRRPQRDPDHRRRLGGALPGADGGPRPRRRSHRADAVLRRLPAGGGLRRRHAGPAADDRSRRFQVSAEALEAHDHAAHQGDAHRLPQQPDRRGHVARATCWRWPQVAERHDLLVISDEIYDRLVYGAAPARVLRRLAGHARPHHHAGRVLQGLCHDRLAHRLRRRPGRRSWPSCARSTSTRSCRRRPWRRRPRSRRSSSGEEHVAGHGRRVRPPPPADRRRAQRARPAHASSRWAPSTPSPRSPPAA